MNRLIRFSDWCDKNPGKLAGLLGVLLAFGYGWLAILCLFGLVRVGFALGTVWLIDSVVWFVGLLLCLIALYIVLMWYSRLTTLLDWVAFFSHVAYTFILLWLFPATITDLRWVHTFVVTMPAVIVECLALAKFAWDIIKDRVDQDWLGHTIPFAVCGILCGVMTSLQQYFSEPTLVRVIPPCAPPSLYSRILAPPRTDGAGSWMSLSSILPALFAFITITYGKQLCDDWVAKLKSQDHNDHN
ncbi:hypothetical protein [Bifidobacterium xylocopae]|uniref:Uncharacterized protein n=1 Tax=Bifidobacterium xylocopae TaxID=2493119 RepID=A0A366KEE1_9BIFI|nr:hypothetical protein [Bifidobacterium xylocopae]RBP99041.1 hypothetical protein CRD59_06120 [Bifidobacterium xylocopae]